MAGTFLYVRLKQNPDHYKIGESTRGQAIDELLDEICSKGIKSLRETNLVTAGERLRCTEFGDAMTRYYIQFATMKIFMGVPRKAKISDIVRINVCGAPACC